MDKHQPGLHENVPDICDKLPYPLHGEMPNLGLRQMHGYTINGLLGPNDGGSPVDNHVPKNDSDMANEFSGRYLGMSLLITVLLQAVTKFCHLPQQFCN